MATVVRSIPAALVIRNNLLLVIDEAGKNISVTGMDPNIIGRFGKDAIKSDDRFQRIVVLGCNSFFMVRGISSKTGWGKFSLIFAILGIL